MGIQKIILNIVLKIEMFFISFFKIKQNRITFISLENDKLTSDMKLIYDQIKHQYDIKLCLIHYQKSLISQMKYFFNCLKQLYLVNTSKIVILHDNNYVVSHFKRKEIHVIQLWHACGAIKKFGNVIKREYPIANYNTVLATSPFWKEAYSQAFSVKKSDVLPIGLPRTDELFNKQWCINKRKYLLSKYPQLQNKKIILYAPTFRGNIYKGFYQINFDAKKVLEKLTDEYVIIYKFHPLVGNYLLDDHPCIINMNHEDTHELFTISDILISDYSSIVFDYMILDKPIIFFTPDYFEYKKDLGVFVDIQNLNLPMCNNEEEIIEEIPHINKYLTEINKLKNQFFEYQDGLSTERIVDYINKYMEKNPNA